MKILILGCNGQLGKCLEDQLKCTSNEVIYTSRKDLDISDFKKTKKFIYRISPDLIINASAYTLVDDAENNEATANIVNNLAVANIANLSSELGNWLIHFSTDYVFDGNTNSPYKENDKTNPQGVYGKTKLKGEQAIKLSACKHIIIRTAWVFSEYGNNFLKTMLRLGGEQQELRIVHDQIGCPTYAQDLAIITLNIIEKLKNEHVKSDLYHYCGLLSCSWYEFAKFIFDEAAKLDFKTPKNLIKVSSSSFKRDAVRPNYSVLNCSKIESFLSIKKSDWKNGVKQTLHNLRNA